MENWHVTGGQRLEGSCFVQGSKNASLPVIAASMISPYKSELSNVPRLRDVDAAVRILEHLGCRAKQEGSRLLIDPSGICRSQIPHSLMVEMRSSVIFMGALIARCGEARLSLPGGCQLGKRPIDLHLAGLRKLGAEIEEDGLEIVCHARELKGTDIVLPFPSVGATENIMLAATRAKGETVIHGAAREPEIETLGEYLRALGAEIDGAGTDTIHICGYHPKDRVRFRMIPDRIVAATIACAAAATGGSVEMRAVDPGHFSTVLHFLKLSGCDIMHTDHCLRLTAPEKLKAVGPVSTQPYPGFPTDAQPVLMAALLRAKGMSLIQENIFEARYRQVTELCKLGADINLDGRIARIQGVEQLHGAYLTATDLRGGAAMILAGLCAEGETVISDIGHVSRGYERFDQVLKALGADIFLES